MKDIDARKAVWEILLDNGGENLDQHEQQNVVDSFMSLLHRYSAEQMMSNLETESDYIFAGYTTYSIVVYGTEAPVQVVHHGEDLNTHEGRVKWLLSMDGHWPKAWGLTVKRDRKIAIIKILRELGAWVPDAEPISLRDAKDAVDEWCLVPGSSLPF